MQTCLLILGIVLAGQLSDASGPRYSSVPVSTPPWVGTPAPVGIPASGGATEVALPGSSRRQPLGQPLGQNPLADQSLSSNPLRAANPSTSPPASTPRYAGSPTTGPASTGAASPSSTTSSTTSPSTSSSPSPTTPPSSGQPLSGQQSTGSSRLAKVIKPVELMSTLAKAAGPEKIAGAELSLETALQNADTRVQQTRCVHRYWELSQAVVQHQLVSLEAVQLSSIYSGLGLAQPNLAWQGAQQSIATRSQVARSNVQIAQLRLQQELGSLQEWGRTSNNQLPLPSDLPYCGVYQTYFEEIFRENPSAEAKQLGQLLPLLHQELGQRATSTVAAQQWYSAVSQQRSPQSDGTQLLRAYEYLALQRRAFVSTAYQYNANIARYTALAVPQNVGTVRLVAMLIDSDARSSTGLSRAGNGTSGDNWRRGAIRRADSQHDLPENGSQSDNQRTFAEQETSKALRVPTNREHQEAVERSILVPPTSP